MARKSTSSSAANSNGHAPKPEATTEEQQQPSSVPGSETLHEVEEDFSPHDRRAAITYDPSLLPSGRRSLSSISLQSFCLGFTLAGCLCVTTYLLLSGYSLWRLPTFFACLSLFHFLEFWTTAQFNMPAAQASSFLLFSNGVAYNVAHSLATLEIVVSAVFPWYQSLLVTPYTILVGLTLVLLGQSARTLAMAQAGTNFNHTPAKTKVEGHVLVTGGIYSWLRHPSYFGFFWWAFGTQVLVGNKVCAVGYLFALWNFFYRRVKGKPGCFNVRDGYEAVLTRRSG